MLRVAAYLAMPLLATGFAYWPVLQNYFFADDFLALWQMRNDPWYVYLLTPQVGHIWIIRCALFAAFDAAFGQRAELWFAAVLVTHLANTALLFLVVQRATASAPIACVSSALWGVAPIHWDCLGWYAAYGHLITGTCTLLILLGVARTPMPARRDVVWWCALALAGALSYGSGLGIALALPVALACLYGRPRGWALWLIVPILYVGIHVLYLRLSSAPIPMAAAALGSADLSPATAVPAVLSMLWHLLAYGVTQMIVGWWLVVQLPSIGASALLATFIVLSVALRPDRTTIALWILALGAYGAIAVGRAPIYHVIFQSNWLSGLVAGRYQYATSIPIALLIARLLAVLPAPRWIPAGVLSTALVASMAAGVARSDRPLEHYDDSRAETARVLARIRELVHRTPPGTVAYIANRPFKPGTIYPTRVLPGWAAAFAIFHPDASLDGRPVRFVIHDPEDLQALRQGRRADLFVSREDVRAAATAP